MTTLLLCTGCDHPLGEGSYCPRCEDVMPTYSYSLSEREAYTLSQVEAEELAFTRAIPHVVHGMAIIDRNAA